MSQAANLAQTFITDFWSADQSIKWLRVEFEASIMLTEDTMLVGRIDALGINEQAKRFFGEWKTASGFWAKRMDEVKASWRMKPQALTYGVLCNTLYPDVRDFTVRWALKTNPPTTDYEWYTYTEAELEWWKTQVVEIAREIRFQRELRKDFPKGSWYRGWPTNLDNCRKYGEKYICPFYYSSCSQLKFDAVPDDGLVRISHLDTERKMQPNTNTNLVILDATRIQTWLNCHERYRREYEENIVGPSSEALETGSQFHDIYGQHLQGLIK